MSSALQHRSILVGCTASGKTAWALDALGGTSTELISVDSCQVYRELSIGSAKPSLEEQRRLPHHLIDCVSVADHYDVGRYLAEADKWHHELVLASRRPMYLGGSMLYADKLMHGLSEIPTPDPKLSALWKGRLESEGLEAMWAYLLSLDASYAGRLHPHDAQRILRAILVWEATGRPLYSYWDQAPKPASYSLAMMIPEQRQDLLDAVRRRTATMLQCGMIDEVRPWFTGSASIPHQALCSVGYRQIWSYLLGSISSLGDLEEAIVASTMRYIKQQMTWMKRWKPLADVVVVPGETRALDAWAKRQALV